MQINITCTAGEWFALSPEQRAELIALDVPILRRASRGEVTPVPAIPRSNMTGSEKIKADNAEWLQEHGFRTNMRSPNATPEEMALREELAKEGRVKAPWVWRILSVREELLASKGFDLVSSYEWAPGEVDEDVPDYEGLDDSPD